MNVEQSLIERCKNNDRQAQKLLFEKYATKMMGICLRYCNNYEDARDVMQDGFIKVFSKINTFKGESSLQTWMSKIFVHTSLNNFRKAHIKYDHVDINEVQIDGDLQKDDDHSAKYAWDQKTVLKAIQGLPDIYRVIINMYAIDGMSHQDISKQLNISEGTSKSRLSRARTMLKEVLSVK